MDNFDMTQFGTVGNLIVLIVTILGSGGFLKVVKVFFEYLKGMRGAAHSELLERIEALESSLNRKHEENMALLEEISELKVKVAQSENVIKTLIAVIRAEMTPEQANRFLSEIEEQNDK